MSRRSSPASVTEERIHFRITVLDHADGARKRADVTAKQPFRQISVRRVSQFHASSVPGTPRGIGMWGGFTAIGDGGGAWVAHTPPVGEPGEGQLAC